MFCSWSLHEKVAPLLPLCQPHLLSEAEGVKQPNPYPAAGRRVLVFVIATQEVSMISVQRGELVLGYT